MANTMQITAPALLGQPIINGNRTLTAEDTLSSAATYGAVRDTSSCDLITIQVKKFGTPTADCSIRIQASLDGSNYPDFITLTNAQITTADGGAFTIQVKAVSVRAVLNVGTMTGANGFKVRYLI